MTKLVFQDKMKQASLLFFSGARLGIIISMFLSGHLAYNVGWSSIFYVFGKWKDKFDHLISVLIVNLERKLRWCACSCNLGNPEATLKSLETGIE